MEDPGGAQTGDNPSMTRPPRIEASLLALAVLVALPACVGGPASTPPALAVSPAAAPLPLHADVAALEWMAGRWVAEGGVELWWTPAGDALFGVGFSASRGRTVAWQLLILRRERGALLLSVMPEGQPEIRYRAGAAGEAEVRFEREGADEPRIIHYRGDRSGGAPTLEARFGSPGHELSALHRAASRAPAPALEAADLRFAAEVERRGVDGWVEAFDAGGGMRGPGKRIEGSEAIRATMREALPAGSHLRWAPLASGLAPAGDLGFTVGRYQYFAPGATATPESTGAYGTVWRRGADGRWRVLFDGGDPEAATSGG